MLSMSVCLNADTSSFRRGTGADLDKVQDPKLRLGIVHDEAEVQGREMPVHLVPGFRASAYESNWRAFGAFWVGHSKRNENACC